MNYFSAFLKLLKVQKLCEETEYSGLELEFV